MSYSAFYFEKTKEVRIRPPDWGMIITCCLGFTAPEASVTKREDGHGFCFTKWTTHDFPIEENREQFESMYFSTGQELFFLVEDLGVGHLDESELFEKLSPELERQYQEALRQAVLTPAERSDPFQEKQLQLLREKEPLWSEPLTAMEFVWVPGGRFVMGNQFYDCDSYEGPPHEVTLGSFWMGRYPVTNEEYWKFEPDHDSGAGFDDPRQPVVEVSWEDALNYVSWLSEKTGYNFSLPTEAQWEYAARSTGRNELFAGDRRVDDVAWFRTNSQGRAHRVGGKVANGLGLHDMSGNVAEWCRDWFDEKYYNKRKRRNPVCSNANSKLRVLRGGSWSNNRKEMRCRARGANWPGERNPRTGFRLVCLPGPRKKNQYLKKPVRQNEKSGSRTRPPKRSDPSRFVSKPEKGTIWTERLTRMDFVWLPEGQFMMGRAAVDRKDFIHETPEHAVELDGFWMSCFPVTNQAYLLFEPDHKNWGDSNDPGEPVVYVDWEDATAFALWMSERTGYLFCLPSEAQWEYAAQIGGKQKTYDLKEANQPGLEQLLEVGTRTSTWRLQDSTSVREWCQDRYDRNFYSSPAAKQRNPVCKNQKLPCYVVRSWNWGFGNHVVRCTRRNFFPPGKTSDDLGFRLVCLPKAP